ncbi:MAG TPA: Pvc16 family protein [Nakamurella sp.]|nr:Pvc16 family protein [Nakamurella sp.]
MSNSLALAATTRTLRNLLTEATPNVTFLPPDKAHEEGAGDQLNVFLFTTALAPAWRNADPIGIAPGEVGLPALPLILHYLVTAYATDEAAAHVLLGRAMSILHDHPVLGEQEIRDATSADLPESDLHLQRERLRVTPLQITTHDMFELWSGFSTNYRPSQAYEVSVVLIDSTRGRTAPLPVLRRGSEDRGPQAVATPAAGLDAVLAPVGEPVVTLGAIVRLVGDNLTGSFTAVRFRNRRLAAPIELVPDPTGTSIERTVALPDLATGIDTWAAGIYDVALVSAFPGLPRWSSPDRTMGLGATVTVAPLVAAPGALNLTLTCRPRLRAGQQVQVLLGSGNPVAPLSVTTPTDRTQPSTVTVTFPGVAAGTYLVRLRVDGVDSNPVRQAGGRSLPEFDSNAQVVVA